MVFTIYLSNMAYVVFVELAVGALLSLWTRVRLQFFFFLPVCLIWISLPPLCLPHIRLNVFTDEYFDFYDDIDDIVDERENDFKDDEKSSSHDSIMMKNRKNVLLEVNIYCLDNDDDEIGDNNDNDNDDDAGWW